MSSNTVPQISFQAKLEANNGTAQAWQVVSADMTVTIPGRAYDKVEVTSHAQTDAYRREIPTLVKQDTLKCKAFYTQAVSDTLASLFGQVYQTSSVKTQYRITTPGGTGVGQTLVYTGWLEKIGQVELNRDNLQEIDFEICVNGPPTITDL